MAAEHIQTSARVALKRPMLPAGQSTAFAGLRESNAIDIDGTSFRRQLAASWAAPNAAYAVRHVLPALRFAELRRMYYKFISASRRFTFLLRSALFLALPHFLFRDRLQQCL
jgi:hypothetical protein